MKLNHDCIRNILLFVENNYVYGSPLTLESFIKTDELKEYSKDEVEYTILKLLEADFLSGNKDMMNFKLIRFYCTGLTWRGHEFLDTVRDPKIWEKIKNAASEFKGVSISILAALGTSFIKQKLNLP